MKQFLANHIKNIKGWKTKRKLLAFAVDDYGNVRVSSAEALGKLKKAGVPLANRFDHLDALDTKDDYHALYDTLSSVKDHKGNSAIFSPYALPCNMDFEKSIEAKAYVGETLDRTYLRMASMYPDAYTGAFEILHEGIKERLIRPQFHGREHLNVSVINALFEEQNIHLKTNLSCYSLAGNLKSTRYPKLKFSESFGFESYEQTLDHEALIVDGLSKFEQVYGYRSLTFTPPSHEFFTEQYATLEKYGVKGIHKGLALKRMDRNGQTFLEKSKMDVLPGQNHATIVRNVVFEPCDENRKIDWVEFALAQVSAAFFWNKPAIVSSHRVNYCGFIDENNRKKGLQELGTLLNKVQKKHPDVEFIALDELTQFILQGQ